APVRVLLRRRAAQELLAARDRGPRVGGVAIAEAREHRDAIAARHRQEKIARPFIRDERPSPARLQLVAEFVAADQAQRRRRAGPETGNGGPRRPPQGGIAPPPTPAPRPRA